jgi:hypothetical protein
MIKTYSELRRYRTFEDRYEYLRLGGSVGAPTFGFDRYLNQEFYRSTLWKNARRDVIARDLGCDLGIEGHEIFDRPYVHHMNPMGADDIKNSSYDIINPEFLITVSHNTHNAIHYGDANLLPKPVVARQPGDTNLW